MTIKKAEKQLKSSLKNTKGVTITKRKVKKFTPEDVKKIKKARNQLKGLRSGGR